MYYKPHTRVYTIVTKFSYLLLYLAIFQLNALTASFIFFSGSLVSPQVSLPTSSAYVSSSVMRKLSKIVPDFTYTDTAVRM